MGRQLALCLCRVIRLFACYLRAVCVLLLATGEQGRNRAEMQGKQG